MSYTNEEFKQAVKDNYSVAGVCRQIGIRPCGGNYRIVNRKINDFKLDVSHFSGQGWRKGAKISVRKGIPLSEILVKGSNYQSFKLKNRLIKEGLKQWKCESCNNEDWMSKKIPLELEHCNGDNTDNRLENLKLLCPNCHAQTDYYRGRNKKSALSEMKEVEYRKLREASLTGNPDPSVHSVNEGAETRHGRSKAKKEPIQSKCLVCDNLLKSNKRKYCCTKCYREDSSIGIPKVPEILEAFKNHKSFTKVGEFFNVSDNAVRKWCLKYGITAMIKV
jgi:Zn finger protein HypA/HybF involved in hydrogenase expression